MCGLLPEPVRPPRVSATGHRCLQCPRSLNTRRCTAPFHMMPYIQTRNRWMQCCIRRSCDSVTWPSIHEIRLLSPMIPRLDMPILRGDYQLVIAPVTHHEILNGARRCVAAFHGQFPTFAERRLNVHYDQCCSLHIHHVILPRIAAISMHICVLVNMWNSTYRRYRRHVMSNRKSRALFGKYVTFWSEK
ncbi:Glyoxalase/bleomycin resistance protein/dioxygenase [Bifidobacterium sp. GSD1FS]|uniref:Glyoxalase/bleomycin resistance protein/dioxygenase n=1 Tax=Bifidobacterium canis TaxID=2610880 RepID=A0A7K1J2K3_9BIFI|nr:Glyoxalase/bleomycin resistance protein/dioxygenase [Bifidobacterium canis]